MVRVMWRNVTGHKLRLLLTALSIILGVAFVSATFILTDSIKSTFSSIITEQYKNINVVVRGAPMEGMQSQSSFSSRLPVPMQLAEAVRSVPGVASAQPIVSGTATLVGKDGTAVRNGGAPTLGASADAFVNSPLDIVHGRMPTADDEIAVDQRTLEKSGLAVGDSTAVVAGDQVHTVTVVGEVRFNSGSLGGATLTVLAPQAARQYFAPDAQVSTIEVRAVAGVSDEQLRDAVATVLPAQAQAVTGAQAAKDEEASVATVVTILNFVLLAFALMALLVSIFIIFNTFAMLVAQRSRELALLRALGAKRSQVTRSVLGEAVLVGVVGSTLGLLLGVAIAFGLGKVMEHFGLDMSSSLPVTARTIAVAYAVGVIVTVVAAVIPARRAGKIAPVEAMRADSTPTTRGLTVRTIIACVLLAIGAGLAVLGLNSSGAMKWTGLLGGILVLLFGALGLTPVLLLPYSSALAVVSQKIFGQVGKLAHTNCQRNPRRSSVTATALTIGVTAVCAMGVFAASYKASVTGAMDDRLTTDYVLSAGNSSLPKGAAQAVQAAAGVGKVWTISPTQINVDGQRVSASTVADAATLQANLRVNVVSGDLSSIDRGQVLVTQSSAQEHGWQVGQTINAQVGANTQQRSLSIGAILGDDEFFLAPVMVPTSLYEQSTPTMSRYTFVALVKAAPGANLEQVQQGLVEAVKPYAIVSVQNREDFKDALNSQVNQGLMILYVLLALTIVIAILGIINTLALSTFERTREIGLLRAVGLTRRQLRRAIRLESILITFFGALLGAVLGVCFGIILRESAHNDGITTLAIPWLQLVSVLAVSVVVGVIAAWWPSHRAARLNMLKAISTE